MTNDEYRELSKWIRFWRREGSETYALRVVELSKIIGDDTATFRAQLKYTRSLFGEPRNCESIFVDSLGTMRAMTETEVSIAAIIGHYVAEQTGGDFLKHNNNIGISHKVCEGDSVWLISFGDTGENQSRKLCKLYENDLHVEIVVDSLTLPFHKN